MHIDSYKLAVVLLNSTLGLEEIPLEVHGRIVTALGLLDQQDDEEFFNAVQDAFVYLGKDQVALETLLSEFE